MLLQDEDANRGEKESASPTQQATHALPSVHSEAGIDQWQRYMLCFRYWIFILLNEHTFYSKLNHIWIESFYTTHINEWWIWATTEKQTFKFWLIFLWYE